jgi:hypothetical protein
LTPQFLNETGNGTLCLPQVTLPIGLASDGVNASLQVVTLGDSGVALYNVDLHFSLPLSDDTFSRYIVKKEEENQGEVN